MVDDRRRRTVSLHADRLALDPLPGISERGLIGSLGDADTLYPDEQPLVVHHREHGFEPAMRLADAPADSTAILTVGQHAGRRGVDAELFLEAQGADVVALARAAVVVE